MLVPLIRLSAHSLFGNDWRAEAEASAAGSDVPYGCGGSYPASRIIVSTAGRLIACVVLVVPG